jgi:glycosyltransferase involved in cell wall biosynthesis
MRHAAHTALRVAQLIETDGPGGAEHVVAELARALQAGGADTTVFLPARGEGWLARQLEGSGASTESFSIDRPVAPEVVRSLAQTFRERRITIAHSHEFSMAVYGAWAARLAGIPHVITMHGGRYYAGKLRRRLALRSAVALSSGTVGVSASVTQALSHDLRMRRSRLLMIPNGVRYERPSSITLREELGLGADARLVVAIGNLYAVKGHQYLIDALDLLSERHPTLHVAIAGRGDLEEPLRARARAYRLTQRVHLLGLRPDVPALMAAADVFVLPSLSEGLPLALLEAMFAGRTIVATDVGDVGVALERGGAGVLVPPGDAGALAAALGAVLDDPDRARRLSVAAAARAAAEYDISRMVTRYVNVYRQHLPALEPAALSAWTPDSTGARTT